MRAEELIAHARSYLYVREKTPNSSPEIDAWLARRHRPPGESYCACFACAMVEDVDPNTKLVPSAGALHLLAINPHLQVDKSDIRPGDILIFDHGKGQGHVSIATNTIKVGDVFGEVDAIAGNTSADGKSRNGDRVAEHAIELDKLAGVLRVCSEPLLS